MKDNFVGDKNKAVDQDASKKLKHKIAISEAPIAKVIYTQDTLENNCRKAKRTRSKSEQPPKKKVKVSDDLDKNSASAYFMVQSERLISDNELSDESDDSVDNLKYIVDKQSEKEYINKEEEKDIDNDFQDSDSDIGMGNSVAESDKEEEKEHLITKKAYVEDIYGRLRDKHGNIIKNKSESYIPPGKRTMLSSTDSKQSASIGKLKKLLKGLLNRLSESNIASIADEISRLYLQYSRNDMNVTLSTLVTDACGGESLTPVRLSMEHVMLIAILHHRVGTEVGKYS